MAEYDPHDEDLLDAPTVARRPGARSSNPASGTHRSGRPQGTTGRRTGRDFSPPPQVPAAMLSDLLHAEEARRIHAFARIALIMQGLVVAQLPWLHGDPDRKAAAVVAIFLMAAVSLWTASRTYQRERFTPAVYRVFGYAMVSLMFVVIHWMGFFSPVTVTLSLGIYALGQSSDSPHSTLLPLLVVFGWVAGAVLVASGAVADVALYPIAGTPPSVVVLMVTGVAGTLLVSAWGAGMAHRSLRKAVHDSLGSALVAQRRGALLDEAHDQLDRAIKHALGKPGAHTGRVAGQYRLEEVIGLGAMGEVYAARHVEHGGEAAVKLLHADSLRREDMVFRFLREATLCSRFDHGNIVQVYDVGRMDDGAPYLAMERLHGRTLSAVLRERTQLPIPDVRQLCQAVGDGLAHAHEKGVVHRDLKPHNIIEARVPGGVQEWKVLDFGISKPMDSSGTLTGDERVLGTPAYMSPEQARGEATDARSDVFSFGTVMYRALTGRPAFPGSDAPRIMFDVAYSMPAQPTSQLADAPPEVDLAFALLLAKRAEKRIGTARDATEVLLDALNGRISDVYRTRALALLRQRPWGSRPSEPQY